MWQRIRCPPPASAYGGSCSSQIAPSLRGQRVLNTQPEGGFAALGNSPSRRMRSPFAPALPSSDGTDDNSASVYGCCGPSNTSAARPDLHEPPEIEHRDAIGQIAHHVQIVRDEHVAHAALALQVGEQIEDRGLHRDVERGRRLVADDDARIARERARNRDALLQSAGKLPRARAEIALGQPHGFGAAIAAAPPSPRRAAKRASTTTARSAAAPICARFSAESGFWNTICSDFTCSSLRRVTRAGRAVPSSSSVAPSSGESRPSKQLGERRLAAAGFADEPERLALREIERDVVHRPHQFLADAERLRHIARTQRDGRLRQIDGFARRFGRRARQFDRALVIMAARHLVAVGGRHAIRRRCVAQASLVGELAAVRVDAASRHRARAAAANPGIVSSRPVSLLRPVVGRQRNRPTVYG